jgi:hypothetical protein
MTNHDPTLFSFHDSVLKFLIIDWEQKTINVQLLFCQPNEPGQPAVLSFSGVQRMTMDCECPWGDSFWINDTRWEKLGALRKCVLEIQSGDEIVIVYRAAILSIEEDVVEVKK